MTGKGGLFLQTILTEMGYALCLKKSAATETIRRPQRLYFLQTGETNDSFSWNLKQSGAQVAEGWKENEFGQFGR